STGAICHPRPTVRPASTFSSGPSSPRATNTNSTSKSTTSYRPGPPIPAFSAWSSPKCRSSFDNQTFARIARGILKDSSAPAHRNMDRISHAFRAFFSLLFSGTLPADIAQAYGYFKSAPVKAATTPTPAAAPKPQAGPSDGAVQILSILQRDSRLVDLLME